MAIMTLSEGRVGIMSKNQSFRKSKGLTSKARKIIGGGGGVVVVIVVVMGNSIVCMS